MILKLSNPETSAEERVLNHSQMSGGGFLGKEASGSLLMKKPLCRVTTVGVLELDFNGCPCLPAICIQYPQVIIYLALSPRLLGNERGGVV